MKKLLFTLLAVMTLVGCTTDNDLDANSPSDGAVNFTISDDDLTRAPSDAKVSWVYGEKDSADELAIFDSSSDMCRYYVASVDESTYTYTLAPYDTSEQLKVLSYSETYTAYYPYIDGYSLDDYKDQTLDKDVLSATVTTAASDTNVDFSDFAHVNCYLTFNFYPGYDVVSFTQIDLYLKDSSYENVWSESFTGLGGVSSYTYSLYYPATSLSGLKLYMVANGSDEASVLDLDSITYGLWVGGTPYNYERVVIGSSDIIYSGGVYEIYTAAGLSAFRDLVNATGSGSASVVYSGGSDYFDFSSTDAQASISGKLMNDIDLSGNSWTPIGDSNKQFSGKFDGNGYEVSGLYISSSSDYQGLFGYTDNATISNLGVSGSVTGGSYIGGVVGYNGSSSVTYCYNSADVSGTGGNIGGVVGYNGSSSTITYCYNAADVSGTGTGDNIGGVVGYNEYYITNCYNLAAVTGGGSAVGGITGDNSGYVVNCYNQGDITGTGNSEYTAIGGVVGKNSGTVKIGYSTGEITATGSATTTYIGGVVGYSTTSTINDCYCLEDTTYSIGWLAEEVDSSNSVTKNCETSDDLKELTSTLNSAAYSYNTTETTPTIAACVWAKSTGGYPVLDFDDTPTED